MVAKYIMAYIWNMSSPETQHFPDHSAQRYRDITWIEQKKNYWGLLVNQIDNFEDFGNPIA